MPKNITVEYVKSLLSYAPETGVLTWKIKKGGIVAGSIAGTTSPFGYRIIMIDQVCYRSHWLAWVIAYGRWPKKVVDHKNRDRCDNRLSNLREATHGQNKANSKNPKKKSGLPKGVLKCREKFGAQIVSNKVHYFLGTFITIDEAHAAYCNAAKKHHGEFARGE